MASACRHVAVTGPPGVGKTTLVQKVVGQLQEAEVACSGFYTKEVRQGGKRVGFDVVTLSGRTGVLSRQRAEGSGGREPRVGNYAVDVASFESLALPLLQTQVRSLQQHRAPPQHSITRPLRLARIWLSLVAW
ncbi:cancer-related nucleoside-triphosphatase homolog [Eriocheir sinensis]|uniref:cancer-related nucleoside-triphosphatase homolog n=1 Tax=Eriocheir sinensis TaxID=95602 RepID=UPI0021C7F35F|nr:cancer-related nucleoside-triphosphatase homolog [Eriocheir sinensis]